ncbi:MAG: tetratricopeptide repeat protein [Bacteroidia bacterium]|nr:tetratricopeptide repeat protein [Bacteroidia bacterium]
MKALTPLSLLCLLMLLAPFANAQLRGQDRIDSLTLALSKAPQDTNKVTILLSLSRATFFTDSASSIEYGLQALKTAEALKNEKVVSEVCYFLGNWYTQMGVYKLALDYLFRSLEHQKKIDDAEGIASILNNIGGIYASMSDFPKALEYAFDALRYFEKSGNKNGQANCLINIGNHYLAQSDYKEALEYYLKAKKVYEDLNATAGKALAVGNIGSVYGSMGEHLKAEGYFRASLDLYRKLEDFEGVERNLSNLGQMALLMKRYEVALERFDSSLALSREPELMANAGYEHAGLAGTYLGLAETKPVNGMPGHYARLARMHADSAVTLLESLGDLNALSNALETQSKIEAMAGNFSAAYRQQVRFKMLNDSIFNMERDRKFAQTALQYEFEKKEAAAKAEQEKKNIRQRNIRNSITAGLGGALIFLVVVYRQRNRISKEKKRSDELLLNILPEEVAEELKAKGEADAVQIDQATVLFTDFKGFTAMSESLSPKELVRDLNECFSAFDRITEKYGIEKIKTIGDSYMAAGGLPTPNSTHAADVVRAALEMRDFIAAGKSKKLSAGHPYFEVRIGVHTGPVVAGIVGVKKFQYDIWGDTVNTASRMESSGEAGKVNVSSTTYALVKDRFACSHRGKISAKGKGEVDMYFVEPM